MFKFFKDLFDWGAIIIGVVTLVLLFVKPELECLDVLVKFAAAFCGIYVIYAISLSCRGPLFDWHLHHGNFLRKVVCLVLLMPFLLTNIIVFFQESIKPEELLYNDSIYKSTIDENSLKQQQVDPPILWNTYSIFFDPGNQTMATTKVGRGWAALIAIFGAFLLNGLLVSSIVGWIDSRREKWVRGEIRYNPFLKIRPRYVIIGGNDMVEGIVKQIFTKAEFCKSFMQPYILIQTSRDVEDLDVNYIRL